MADSITRLPIDTVEHMVEALRRAESSISLHNIDRVGTNEHDRCNWDFGEGHGGTLDVIRAALARYEASK